MLGHDGPPTNYYRENLISVEPLTECPLRTLLRAAEEQSLVAREIARHAEEYFPAYEAGYLLMAGGISDQPALYVDYMNELTDLRARQQAKWSEIQAANEALPTERPT